MKALNIKTPNKMITLSLIEDDLSIVIGEDHKAAKAPALEWSDTLLDGNTVDFEAAEKAVAALGTGWRLPTRAELESLLDLSRHDPAIDTRKFSDTESLAYWTSTPCAWNEAVRWVVGFGHGGVHGLRRGYDACVRAVRSGQ